MGRLRFEKKEKKKKEKNYQMIINTHFDIQVESFHNGN